MRLIGMDMALGPFRGMAQFEGYEIESPESPGMDGDTPLHVAAALSDSEPLAALLPYVTNIDVEGDMGNTPLHVAVIFRREMAARLLIRHGARLDVLNDYDESPLEKLKAAPEMGALLSEIGTESG